MSIRIVKPSTFGEKKTRTTLDVQELTPKLVASWKAPPFQRDLKINARIQTLVEEIRLSGVVPGVLTLGHLDGEVYLVDGQHRVQAFRLTDLPIAYADVRTHWFESMGEMAAEFVNLNRPLVPMRPDDILRGLEASTPALQQIRRKCGFVGYDMVRRGEKAPVLSMSVFVRAWISTRTETPQAGSALAAVQALDEDETKTAIVFATLCYEAWSRDVEYNRLWSALNLTLCAWLFRRMVLGERQSKASRVARLTAEEFRRCLMALSADPQYLDFLVGRTLRDRDRAPTYARIKTIFAKRHLAETGRRIALPQPAWAHVSS